MATPTRASGTYSSHETAGATGPIGPLTGRAAYLGITERGPADKAVLIGSWKAFLRRFGGELSNSDLPTQTKHHFDLGGGPIVVARNQGVGATKASANIPGSSGTTLILTAADAGAHANEWEVDRIVSGTSFQLVVKDGDGTIIADTGFVATRDEVPDLLASNIYVNATIGGGTGDATAGTGTAFTGGANGTTNDASAAAALALLTPDLGTLQVYFPGDTSSARHAQVKEACAPGVGPRRTAVVEHADASASTSATAIRNLWGGQPAVHSVSSAPYNGSVVFGGTLFCVAASISDRQRLPGHALAAGNATFPQLHSLTREFSEADKLLLEEAGATYLTLDEPNGRGVRNVQIHVDRVGSDPDNEDEIYEASDLRTLCALDALLRFALRPWRQAPITPQVLSEIHTAASGVGVPFYRDGLISDDDGVTGSTGEYGDAFRVEVEQTGQREVTTTAFTRPSAGIAVQQITVVRRTQEA